MGQGISAPKDRCVSIQGIDELMNVSFSVKRTSGELESGWLVPKEHHHCAALCPAYCSAAAWKSLDRDSEAYVWRIFMRNDKEDLHACGWRRLNTIQPTNLLDDEQAINVWRNKMIVLLEIEEDKRLTQNVLS